MTTATPRQEREARPRATYQDVLEAPPHRVSEVVDGVLYTNPRPAMPHALASSALEIDLGAAFQFGRGGPVAGGSSSSPSSTSETTSSFPTSLAGAASGCRAIPRPRTPHSRRTGSARSSRRRPAGSTLRPSARVYAREGVRHLWLVDPAERTLEAFELTAGEWSRIATAADDEPVRIVPFEAVSFSLGDLWP